MKIKFATLLLMFFAFSANSFSQDYEKQINSLQKQIDLLNKKFDEQNTNNSNLNNFIKDVKINGRLHLRGSWYNKDEELKSYNTDNYNNKLSVKRLRINLSKKIDKFVLQFDSNFDRNKSYLGDAFIGYVPTSNTMIKVGQILPSSFIEREKSSNTNSTIDYNSVLRMSWIPWYLIGINFSWKNKYTGISTGIFGNSTGDEDEMKDDTDYSFFFRNYYSPVRNNSYVLHLGYNLFYKDYNNDTINNADKIAESYYYGLEAGFQYKYVTIVNEYIKNYYKYKKTRFDGNRFNFDGFSSELVVNFTGEKKNYNSSGSFGAIKVKNPLSKGGYGAFQGVFRYSYADGKDKKALYLNNIGSSYDYTFGLTWIMEDYLRLLFNYSINDVIAKNYEYKGKYDAFKIELRMFF